MSAVALSIVANAPSAPRLRPAHPSLPAASETDVRAALDRLGTVVLLATPDARVYFANDAARQLLATGDGVSLENERLRGSTASDTARIRNTVREAAAGAANRILALPRRSVGRPLAFRATPLHSAGPAGSWPVMIVLCDPDRDMAGREAVLQALHGLTPAEARLASLILQGLSVREASEVLDVTIHTGRTHLKRILGKTGTRRQAELVRLLCSAAPMS